MINEVEVMRRLCSGGPRRTEDNAITKDESCEHRESSTESNGSISLVGVMCGESKESLDCEGFMSQCGGIWVI